MRLNMNFVCFFFRNMLAYRIVRLCKLDFRMYPKNIFRMHGMLREVIYFFSANFDVHYYVFTNALVPMKAKTNYTINYLIGV